jgi:hypothetical protein
MRIDFSRWLSDEAVGYALSVVGIGAGRLYLSESIGRSPLRTSRCDESTDSSNVAQW